MRLYLSLISLRTRLLLLILAALLPAVGMLVFQNIQNNQNAHRNLARDAEFIAYQIATFSKETLSEPDQFLAHLATVPELRQTGPACDAFLASTLKSVSSIENILVLRPDGEVVCSGLPQIKPANFSDSPQFQNVIASKATSIGNLQINKLNTQPVIVFARPIMDEQQTITHVLSLSVKTSSLGSALSRALASSPEFQGVAAAVIDTTGTIIAAAPSYEHVGQKIPDWQTVHEKLNTGALTQSETWRDTTPYMTAYLPLYSASTGTLHLRVGLPLAGPLESIQSNSNRNFLVVAIGSLLALAAAWALSNWLVLRPIGILNRTATQLGRGVLSARTGLGNSGGEVGALARQFDNMAQQLQRQHDALLRIGRVQAVRSATNSAVLRADNEKKLLDDICALIRRVGGYELSWVGYAPTELAMPLQPQAHSGADQDILNSFSFTNWNEHHPDPGPVTNAIRTGTSQVFQGLSTASTATGWRLQAASKGYASAIGLPLQVDNTIIGGLGIFSADPQAFGPEEIRLLTETANDVSFGLSALRATNELRRSQEFLGLVVNNIPSMVFVKDAQDLRFVSMNPAGELLTGFREAEVIGKTDYDLFPPEQADVFAARDRAALSGRGRLAIADEAMSTAFGDIRMLHTKKLPLLGADDKPKYLLGISDDITEQKKINEQLVYLATHDALTGLPNRGLLIDRLMQATLRAKHMKELLALLYVDIDGFKEINDTLGHFTGDKVLQTVTALLKATVPDIETIARVGGDEFVLILESISSQEEAAAAASLIKQCFQTAIKLSDREIFLTVSIGISLYPTDSNDCETLLRIADIAMYHAKSEGRNTYVYYSHNLEAHTTEKVEMRNLLRQAIDKNELILHYQPKVSVLTGKIIGAEALIRWNCAGRGLISPAQFIPLAEESGLIIPIGEWVLRAACEQAMQWQQQGFAPLIMAVNLSPRQFRQSDLRERIQQTLADTGLRPEYLELEVTEGAIMDNAASAIRLLNDIDDMGVLLAIDDFGTGYSSLAYLKQLPVSVLKIDQSFVKGLTSEADDAAIVTAVIAMAKSLRLAVTAEGVETEEQLEALRKLGCDNYQGYYFSKSIPAQEFVALLARQT